MDTHLSSTRTASVRADAIVAAAQGPIVATIFPDEHAFQKKEVRHTLDSLANLLHRRQPAKALLKLAMFGDDVSPAGAYRHDDNLLDIHGVEVDYDGGEISFADAENTLRMLALECILHTTRKHTPDKPRWRVLCPTSAKITKARRAKLLDLLNGAFDGKLAAESWTLSQSWYFGNQCPSHFKCVVLHGAPIDLCTFDGVVPIPGKPTPAARPDVRVNDPAGLDLDAGELIARVRAAPKDGPSFVALFDNGDISAYGGDNSRADQALCGILARKGGRAEQIDELFRKGALWRGRSAERWDKPHAATGETYGQMTIRKALERVAQSKPKGSNGSGNGGTHPSDPKTVEVFEGEWSVSKSGSRELVSVKQCPNILTAQQFIDGFVAPDFIIDDIVQRGYIYSLTGRTGDGKTALMLSMGIAVATGKPFGGKKTEEGRVVYLAGENPDDIRARFIMMCEGMEELPDIYFIAGSFDIEETMHNLQKKVQEIGGADLVFVDTSAAYFQGDEENSNTQLGNWARRLRELCDLSGKPTVIVGCHPTKSARQKSDLLPRGGGAFLAEVDGNLCCLSDDRETTELHWTGKLRGPGFEPLSFQMDRKTSEKVQDKKGRLIPSVMAVHIDDQQVKKSHVDRISDEDGVLEAMRQYPNGSLADWAKQLGWFLKDGEPYKTKVSRCLENLVNDKLVTKNRKGYELTAAGEKEADAIIGLR